MMHRALIIFLGLLVLPPPASPCPVQLNSGATCLWHSYIDDTETNAAQGPYWDGNSWDTRSDADNPLLPDNHVNVGSLLEGHTAIVHGVPYSLGPDAPGPSDFWTRPDHSGADAFSFLHAEGDTPYRVTMLAEIAAHAPDNEFGWFAPSTPSVLHPIFTGSDTRYATWTGTIPGEFGFYLRDTTRGVLLTTLLDSGQFAPFLHDDVFYLGIEDLVGPIAPRPGVGLSDYDYNDMIVTFEQVPEPASLVMLGTGLIVSAAAAARRRRPRQAGGPHG